MTLTPTVNKQKLNTAKTQLSELTIVHESTTNERNFLREQVESLAVKTATTEEKTRSESSAKRSLENELENLSRRNRDMENRHTLDLETKERVGRPTEMIQYSCVAGIATFSSRNQIDQRSP